MYLSAATYYGEFEEDRNKRGSKGPAASASASKDTDEDYTAQLDQINVSPAAYLFSFRITW